LAIDDDPNVIYLLKENLADAGYRVEGATDAQDGLIKARTLRPKAITLDVVMPGGDGWQVLHALKGDALTRDIPVIMLSIVDQKELGFRLGAAEYLIKPIEREALLKVLDRVAPRCRRLLLVDDDPQIRNLVPQLFEGTSIRVRVVPGAHEALTAMQQAPPDCILLDLLMPGMDGFELLETLQQRPELRAIPVVILSAKELTVSELATLSARAHAVLPKAALDRDTLVREVQRALAGAGRAP
jgi:CheY-like chemotaxis protein